MEIILLYVYGCRPTYDRYYSDIIIYMIIIMEMKEYMHDYDMYYYTCPVNPDPLATLRSNNGNFFLVNYHVL